MVILYSGGLDSTVLLYEYKDKIKLALSFDYKSKHNDREFEFARKNTSLLKIEHLRIPLFFINDFFKSSLLKSGGDIPEGHYQDSTMKSTVVPFRNGIMLSVACGIAESRGLDTVLIANHSGDHAIYPDCRSEFIDYMSGAMTAGTYNKVKILAPYTSLNKRDIALIGNKLNVDFNLTYSCYKGNEIHCGKCGTCIERKEALLGFDNTIYEN